MKQYHCENLEQLISGAGYDRVVYLLELIEQKWNKKSDPFYFFGRLLWEYQYNCSDKLVNFLQELSKKNVFSVIFLNKHLENSKLHRQIVKQGSICVFIDFFFWRTYCEIFLKNQNKVNQAYNFYSDKFLFLTGKPNKINRVGLLWKLYQKKLLENCVWSFYVQDADREDTKKILDLFSAADTDIFIDRLLKNPDSINIKYWTEGSCHYGGIPYDPNLYANSKFRLISETSFSDHKIVPWVTEKTWLTIINRNPFIMAGDTGTLDYLESLGFKTFKEYQRVPEYDKISGFHDRLDTIVTNVSSWLTDTDNSSRIVNDVSHNYDNFLKLAKKYSEEYQACLHQNNIHFKLEDIVSTSDFYDI